MRVRHWWKKPTCRGAMIGVACALVCCLLNTTESVRVLEGRAQDDGFLLRGQRPSEANVVIVALDEPSFQALGKPMMFSSPELAKVVTYLRAQGAAAIGVDILIPESEETIADLLPGRLGDSQRMGVAVGQAGIVVLPEFLAPGAPTVQPLFEWQAGTQSRWTGMGFVNLTVDPDRYLRRQRLRATDRTGLVVPSFALAMFGLKEALPADWLLQPRLDLDGGEIPVEDEDSLRINYVGPPGTIPSVSFSQVLQAADNRVRLDRDFSGAMVLIGTTSPVMPDFHATPYLGQSILQTLGVSWFGRGPELMSGVEVHANVLATLCDRAFITTPWWLATPLLLVLVGAGLGAAFARLGIEAGAGLALAHHVVWRGFSLAAFWIAHWRVEMVSMLVLGVLLYGVVFVMRWRWMRRMFGMVKSEAIARVLEADPEKLDLRGEEREISVLFSDIRNFTPFSEKHTPHEVVALLNGYFTAVVPILEARGGTIAQFNGDGVMVIFGAPEPQADHAARAIESAVDMVRRVHELKDRWKALGASDFRIGVGVHTGRAVVGTVGSPSRLDYTAHGDTINTASRIESGNKELHTEVLFSQATFLALLEEVRRRLAPTCDARELSVKGKERPVAVYSIRTEPVASGPAMPENGPAKPENDLDEAGKKT